MTNATAEIVFNILLHSIMYTAMLPLFSNAIKVPNTVFYPVTYRLEFIADRLKFIPAHFLFQIVAITFVWTRNLA